jgi:hypothetical protein
LAEGLGEKRDLGVSSRLRESRGGFQMRAVLTGFAVAALVSSAALAATKLAPKEIQTEFFDGKPFTAATTSGTKFKLTFSPDGKVTREPQDKAGQKGEGTWKLTKEGFCTQWKGSGSNCYTIVNVDKNKWSVVKGAATVAVWSK